VSGVFFDFAEFYFNSLLLSQDEEKHSDQQNQNNCHCDDYYVTDDAYHYETLVRSSRPIQVASPSTHSTPLRAGMLRAGSQ
jgi:hypothetical protein